MSAREDPLFHSWAADAGDHAYQYAEAKRLLVREQAGQRDISAAERALIVRQSTIRRLPARKLMEKAINHIGEARLLAARAEALETAP